MTSSAGTLRLVTAGIGVYPRTSEPPTCSREPRDPNFELRTCSREPHDPTLELRTCGGEPRDPTLELRTCSREPRDRPSSFGPAPRSVVAPTPSFVPALPIAAARKLPTPHKEVVHGARDLYNGGAEVRVNGVVRAGIASRAVRWGYSASIGASLLAAMVLYAAAVAWWKILPLYDCVVLVPLLAAEFWVLDCIDAARPVDDAARLETARLRAVVLFGASAILCTAFLVRLWTLGYEGRNAVVGGILPWSDSADFNSDALRLVHGERFSTASSRRPLFSAVLATLLWASGGNLRIAIGVLTVVGAAAMTLPALEVWRTHGARAAFVVYLVFVFFERRWTGFIQTEHLGLPLGSLGFVLLWRASSGLRSPSTAPNQRAIAIATGIFAVALGLFARAGCFFVLPMVALWGAQLAPRPRRWHAFAGFMASAGLALAVHEAVVFATATGSSFSDYPAIAYGLLHGKDFTWMGETHRWILLLPLKQRAFAAWRVLGADLLHAPWLVPLGLARSFVSFVVTPYGLFSYVYTNPDDRIFQDGARVRSLWESGGLGAILEYWRRSLGAFSIVNTAAMTALGIAFVVAFSTGAVRVLRRSRATIAQPVGPAGLLLASTVGILTSVPFMPPWITSGMQVQTATLGFAATTAAMIFARPQRHSGSAAEAPAPVPSPRILVRLLAGAVALLAAGLTGVCLFPERSPGTDVSPLHWVHLDGSATVDVAHDRTMSLHRKAIGDLRTSLGILTRHNEVFVTALRPSLHEGTLYHSVYDPSRSAWEILVDEDRELAGATGWVAVDSLPLEASGAERLIATERDRPLIRLIEGAGASPSAEQADDFEIHPHDAPIER